MSSKKRTAPDHASRRALLKTLGTGLVAMPFLALVDCAGSSKGSGTSDAGPLADAGTDAGGDAGPGDAGAVDAGPIAWATGGTAAMWDKANYPDPFASGLPTACALTCAMTLGPCYDAATVTREDISEGQAGLPLRLAFQILDEDCQPVTDATLDIWHCNPVGVYSGDDASENVAFCTGNDATAMAAKWFRGVGATDSQGRVYFDTCFPGWYSSRTIHIHFTVRRTTGAVTEYLTAQFFFDDALDDEIISTQPVYNARPHRDTTNLTDTVITPAEVSNYVFQTQQMRDGAMLAWKTIIIRKATSEAQCSVSGSSSGPGGDGGMGPPPGGDGGMGPPPGDGGFGPPPGDGGFGPPPGDAGLDLDGGADGGDGGS